jgi:cytochrome c-type biogenesis protein CcmF
VIVLAGRVCLALALLAGVATIEASWRSLRSSGDGESAATPARWLRLGPLLMLAGTTLAFALLQVALFTDDFSVQFVVEHHRRATGALYTATSAWAGLEGSLLLWTLIIAAFLYVVSRRAGRDTDDRVGIAAVATMGVIATFFVGLVLLVAPTFATNPEKVSDGTGANPLLQDNPLMAIHPPLLYLGYVGFMVPFAFAVGALLVRAQGPSWVLRTQRWALVAWTFLTIGILIGGLWSYEVLGWGGYWAWDPVENASFLPWLSGTAFLHSAVMHARRGMLPAWSVGLVLSTFLFTLLGTFLARSGVIASVHAFSGSSLGPVLLVFLLLVTAAVGWLFVTRLSLVSRGPRLSSLLSGEGAFLLNNLLLAFFAVVVLVGTISPIVLEAINGDRIAVGRPFFDVWAVWISLGLMLAMVIGAVAPYRRTTLRELWGTLRIPMQCGLAFAAVLIAFGLREPYVIVVSALCGLVVATAIHQLLSATRARTDHRGRVVALLAALRARPGYWGGQVAHIGLAVVALGIAASSGLAERATISMQPGETISAAGLELTYMRPTVGRASTFTLEPSFRQYPNLRQPIGIPDVWTSSGGSDAYLAIVGLDDTGVSLRVIRYPFLILIWIGGCVMTAGGAFGLLLRRWRRRVERASLLAVDDLASTTA